MKKILVLMLVLCMASLANAHLIFTVNGEEQGPAIDPPLLYSDTIELDLELSAGETINGYQLMYTLSNAQAEFLSSGIAFPWASDFPGKINGEGPGWIEITAGNMFNPSAGPLDLMNGLIVHCLEATDVILTVTVSGDTIIDGETIANGTIVHELLIPQIIPEPMTIALLGLGGLLLRRRK